MKFALIILSLIAVSCSSHKKVEKEKAVQVVAPVAKAFSEIRSSKLSKVGGTIIWEDSTHELKVKANLQGLKPNSKLGFHVHEKGLCEGPEYKTAGEHFNPGGHDHSRPENKVRHLGDMGNLTTNSKGEVSQTIVLPKLGMDDLKQLAGRSVVIHAKKDDFKTQPSGDSGGRIACGIIHPLE